MPAGENFPVSGQIGANVEQRLASAGMNTESGDDFVKNQGPRQSSQ